MRQRHPPATEYERRGYLVLHDLLDGELLSAVRRETTAICSGDRGAIDGAATTMCTGDDALCEVLCVHFPHKISPIIRDLATLPPVVDALTSVIGPNVKMMQSMLFVKAPGKRGQAWHQDESHIPTRDGSLTAVWIALDDATVDNGCLWALPGSHGAGVLHPVRDHADPRFDPTPEAHGFGAVDGAIPLELPAGDAVVFDGYLLHRSFPNRQTHGLRRAVVNHYMSAESLLPWEPSVGTDNIHNVATADVRDVLLIAGIDPHAAKGTVDVHHPRLRPDEHAECTPATA